VLLVTVGLLSVGALAVSLGVRSGAVSLEERLARLEEEVAAIRSDLSSSGSGSPRGIPTGSSPRSSELEARLTELEERLTELAGGRGPDGSSLDDRAASEREVERTRQSALEKRLNLTVDERAAVARILQEESDAHGSMLEDLWNADTMRGKHDDRDVAELWDQAVVDMKDLRQSRDQKLEKLLGRERYEQLQAAAKESKNPRRPGPPNVGPTGVGPTGVGPTGGGPPR
jgi:hypothetical protein